MSRTLLYSIILTGMLFLASCRPPNRPPTTPGPVPTPTATATPIACDSVILDLAGFVPFAQLTPVPSFPNPNLDLIRGVIRTTADWSEFCQLIGQDPLVFLPPVDLNSRMLVFKAFAYPECQTNSNFTGYECAANGSTARVHHVTYANIRCITGPLGWIFKAYSVPTSGLPVTWVETSEVTTTNGVPPPSI